MIDILKKLGAGGCVGFLLGLAAVWWIEPATPAGTALLILICIAACGVIGAAFGRLFGSSKPPAATTPPTPPGAATPPAVKPPEPDDDEDGTGKSD